MWCGIWDLSDLVLTQGIGRGFLGFQGLRCW